MQDDWKAAEVCGECCVIVVKREGQHTSLLGTWNHLFIPQVTEKFRTSMCSGLGGEIGAY